jgi:hypothetical protein
VSIFQCFGWTYNRHFVLENSAAEKKCQELMQYSMNYVVSTANVSEFCRNFLSAEYFVHLVYLA